MRQLGKSALRGKRIDQDWAKVMTNHKISQRVARVLLYIFIWLLLKLREISVSCDVHTGRDISLNWWAVNIIVQMSNSIIWTEISSMIFTNSTDLNANLNTIHYGVMLIINFLFNVCMNWNHDYLKCQLSNYLGFCEGWQRCLPTKTKLQGLTTDE